MLILTMPTTFKKDEPADCRINKQPAKVTWVGDSLYFAFDDGRREKRLIVCMKPSSVHKVPTGDADWH